MNVIIIFCLASMTALISWVVLRLALSNRAQKLDFFKNFKLGPFTFIYIVAVPLCWCGYYFNNGNAIDAFLSAVNAGKNLLVLRFDYQAMMPLMQNNALFKVAIDICYVLVFVNAAMLTVTLFIRKLYNFGKLCRVKRASKVYVVLGDSAQNRDVIQSILNEGGKVMIVAKRTDQLADYCFVNRVAIVNKDDNDVDKTLSALFKSFKKKRVNVIVNCATEDKTLVVAQCLAQYLEKIGQMQDSISDVTGLYVYVLCNTTNDNAFLRVAGSTHGFMRFVDSHKVVAMDFVNAYPLTLFMDERHVDYDTATLRSHVQPNVVMLGFGKTNQALFQAMVVNNQFFTFSGGKLQYKPVSYYVYDKVDSRNDKNLNHCLSRYEREVGNDKSAYLPLPPKPADAHFFKMDLADTDLYKTIRAQLSAPNAYNYVVVSFGEDMENLDFAEKINCKLKEWQLDLCTKVFVRICDDKLQQVIQKTYEESGFILFGNKQKLVYDVSHIVAEKQEDMARNRHLSYSLRDEMDYLQEQQALRNALVKWNEMVDVQRQSNVFACVNVRTKLHLLGFDVADMSSKLPDERQAFLSKYQQGDAIVYDDNQRQVKGKRTIVYTNDFVNYSLRNVLARQEHQRWNAYMISCGVVPSTIEQIKAGDSKNLALRRHGNICTFEGLQTFCKYESERTGLSQEQTDVIRYDYQIMDDLVWLLDNNQLKIVKKQK